MNAHIAALKENTAGLVQITRAYYTDRKGDEKVLSRKEYTIIGPKQRKQDTEGEQAADDRKLMEAATGTRVAIRSFCRHE